MSSIRRTTKHGVLCCAFLVPVMAAMASDWTLRTNLGPSPRDQPAMAYDSCRSVVVLFGGTTAGVVVFNDTWEWDGVTWSEQTTATRPSARFGHAMAYDTARAVTVLFGGRVGGAPSNDTWEWDGATWILRSTDGPPPRRSHAMAYDSTRGVVVLSGGFSGSTFFTDTWEWDGATWIQRISTVQPPGRDEVALVYDSCRGVTVLFGGNRGGNCPSAAFLNDTWEWDGTDWIERMPAIRPSVRWGHAMAFDNQRCVGVLFGGVDCAGMFNDTWEWDGVTWSEQTTATFPSARAVHRMAYDIARNEVVLFGGSTAFFSTISGETWAYGPETPEELLDQLIEDIIDLNLQQGIENSLDAKLDAVLQALEDMNENNDVAACNALQAFINTVEAQSGKHVPEDDTAALIAAAQALRELLGCPS